MGDSVPCSKTVDMGLARMTQNKMKKESLLKYMLSPVIIHHNES